MRMEVHLTTGVLAAARHRGCFERICDGGGWLGVQPIQIGTREIHQDFDEGKAWRQNAVGTMEDTQYILIADYVPVANKGEEAIIRGMEDMLRDGRPMEIGLFDNVSEVTRRGNITLFPRRWIFRVEGELLKGPLPRLRKIMRDVSVCAQIRAPVRATLACWAPQPCASRVFERVPAEPEALPPAVGPL